MGAFGQVTVTNAMVGKYTSGGMALARLCGALFIGFTAAGVSVACGVVVRAGRLCHHAARFRRVMLLVIAAAIILRRRSRCRRWKRTIHECYSRSGTGKLARRLACQKRRAGCGDAKLRCPADRAAQPPAAGRQGLLSDKLVALDRDKAEFCYQLCRANDARRIVEIGTSYGSRRSISRQCARQCPRQRGNGVVIGTEYEANKARRQGRISSRRLSRFIDLREGDTARDAQANRRAGDFMLVDIWITMARPALELVTPHLRSGAIVISDNTEQYRSEYARLLRISQANGSKRYAAFTAAWKCRALPALTLQLRSGLSSIQSTRFAPN